MAENQKNLGVLVSNQGITLSEEVVFGIICEMFPQYKQVDIKIVKDSMINFTAASYKSVIQKIIRFRPEQVQVKKGLLQNTVKR